MALRALLRKAPALGLGPRPPTATALRALSPSAGSRSMSRGGPGGEAITEDLARRIEKFDWMTAEERAEVKRRISENMRAINENEKKLKMIMMASNAAIIVCVPATLYMLYHF